MGERAQMGTGWADGVKDDGKADMSSRGRRVDNGQGVIASGSQAKMKYLQFHRVPGLRALTPFVWK